MAENHAPYISDPTMRNYNELSKAPDKIMGKDTPGVVENYGNQAWGAGNASAHGDYARDMALGGLGGGALGLLHEALRRKTNQEKNQSTVRKLMRYAGKGGLGALAGAGAGGLYQAAMHKVAVNPMTPEKPIAPNNFLNAAAAEDGRGYLGVKPHAHLFRAMDSLPNQQLQRAMQEKHEDAVGMTNRINATLGGNKPRLVPATPQYQAPALPTPPAGSPPRGTGAGAPPAPVQLGKKAASDWKGVDLAKNPINYTRVLPKADASSKNWQGAGQKPAAPANTTPPPMVPVNQAPPMVPVGAKTAARQPTDSRLSFRTGTPGSLSFTGEKTPLPPKKEETKKDDKTAQLRNFGTKVALNLGSLTQYVPEGLQKVMPAAGAGALGGAALGGLHGLISPGHDDIYDDAGNVVGRQRRSRFGAMLRGALGGGAAGGLAGGALEAYHPGAMGRAQNWLRGKYELGRHNVHEMMGKAPSYNAVDNVPAAQMAPVAGMA